MLHFDPKALRPVIEEAQARQCELLLVKDEGIYLMPADGERNDAGRAKHLAYADGCHPEMDECWYDNARALVGGDDFGERLTVDAGAAERILTEGYQLWILAFDDAFIINVAPAVRVPVADYRRITARMRQLAEVHYSLCRSRTEFKHWRERAINLPGTACHTGCRRAKPADREDHQAMFRLLKQRAAPVSARGALRYPVR